MELLGTFILPTEPRAVTKGLVLLHVFLVIPEKKLMQEYVCDTVIVA